MTTNNAAPVLTPSMPGSASGLRVTPCIDRAGDAEGGADEQPDDRAGDAQRADDEVVVVRRVGPEEGVEHGVQREVLGPVAHAEQADTEKRNSATTNPTALIAWRDRRRKVAVRLPRRPEPGQWT